MSAYTGEELARAVAEVATHVYHSARYTLLFLFNCCKPTGEWGVEWGSAAVGNCEFRYSCHVMADDVVDVVSQKLRMLYLAVSPLAQSRFTCFIVTAEYFHDCTCMPRPPRRFPEGSHQSPSPHCLCTTPCSLHERMLSLEAPRTRMVPAPAMALLLLHVAYSILVLFLGCYHVVDAVKHGMVQVL